MVKAFPAPHTFPRKYSVVYNTTFNFTGSSFEISKSAARGFSENSAKGKRIEYRASQENAGDSGCFSRRKQETCTFPEF